MKVSINRRRRTARGMLVVGSVVLVAVILVGCGASGVAAPPPLPTPTDPPPTPIVITPPTATVPPIATSSATPVRQVIVITPAVGDSSPLAPGGRIITPIPAPIGGPAPEFMLTAGDGSTLTKAALAGKPTLLFFFASWCPHCQAEAAPLTQIAAAHPDITVVAIGVHDHETAQDIYAFQTRFALPFPTYDDGGKAAQAYGIYAFPTMIAVARAGIIRGSDIGEVPLASLETLVDRAKR